MACKYNIEDFIDYTDGVLPDEKVESIRKHMETCEECRTRQEALACTDRFVENEASVREDFYKDVIRKLDIQRYSGKGFGLRQLRSLRKSRLVLVPVAAVMLICLVTILVYMNFGSFKRADDINKQGSVFASQVSGSPDTDADETVEKKVNGLLDFSSVDPAVKASSNPFDYIKAKQSEYDSIVKMGEPALAYLLDRLGRTAGDGLDSWIMAKLCCDILGENNPVKTWSSGKEWFNLYQGYKNGDTAGAGDLLIDSGRYTGQIDSNSIEIKISGVPDEMAAKAFRLSEKVKSEFDSYGLKKDDVIKVYYRLNQYDQPVIEKIEKI